MSKTVSLKIDGKDVTVPEGTNLIDAAEKAGIHIPNLCYLKGMRGIGACRLCLVEMEGAKAPVTACTTKVKEGMNVTTSSEKILEMRRFVIDLILSMHPLDCMTCTKAGVCNLQHYAYNFEIKESSFTRKKFGFSIDEANPFIKRDPDYCILCGRCVRVCKEQGTNVLDFMGRGVGSKVVTANDKPLQESGCTFCGSCVDVCPVNAILEADRWRKGREWEYEREKSLCLSCGNGCDITVSKKDGLVVKVNAGAEDGSVERYICAIGRFGFDSLTSDSRLHSPMKREGNELKETTWEEALRLVAERLKEAGDKAGIVSTAGILNQDALMLSRFASDVLKTDNIDTTASLYTDPEAMNSSDHVDMDEADLFILVGLNPSQWERVLPALDAGLRKRVARGAKLVVINSSDSRISSIAAVSIKDDEASSLARIARSLTTRGAKPGKEMEAALSGVETNEDSDKVADLLKEAKTPVIFCSPSLFKASRNISLLTGVKVVAVPLEANARGVMAADLTPKGKGYNEMISGGLEALYVIGDVPISKRPGVDFLVVQTSHLTDLAKEADVVLPATTYLESEGSIINYLGKVKHITKVVEAPGSARQHGDILAELSRAMGSPLEKETTDLKPSAPSEAFFSPFEKRQGLDINALELIQSINTWVINTSRLLWLKETEKTMAV